MSDLLQTLASATQKLAWGEHPVVKWLLAACGAVMSYVAGEGTGQRIVLAAAGLIALDAVTGVAASWYERKPIQSRVMGRTIVKILAYGSTLLVAAVMAREIAPGSAATEWSVGGIATLVIVTESVSILENAVRLGIRLPGGLLEKTRERLGIEPRGRGE